MKALTVCQPYAHLIAIGDKFVENRTWNPSYRGRIAIHAGLSRSWLEDDELFLYPDMSFGAIVAICNLREIIHIDKVRAAQPPEAMMATIARIAQHKHTVGPWCWVLDDIVRLDEPIPMKGAQSLWTVPPEYCEKIVRDIRPTDNTTS